MKINIKGTNLELTPSIYEYVERKIGELDKFVEHVGGAGDMEGGTATVEAFVEVGRTSYHHRKGDVYRAEVQIRLPHVQGIRAVSETRDLHQAIDEVKDEIQRQLKDYTSKQRTKFKRGRRAIKKLSNLSPLARFRGEK